MKSPAYRVSDVADQIRGVTYSKQDATKTARPGYVPILRAGNITDDGLTFDDLVYVPCSKVSPNQKIQVNDIVIAASSGSLDVVGKAARVITNFNGGFGAFCKVLRPRKEVHAAYFSHYFRTPEYRRQISSLAAGININNLRNGDLDNLQIHLPPLADQRRIAEILDAADALRAKRRESIAHLNALLKSTFLTIFGDPIENPKKWDVGVIGDLLLSANYGTSKKADSEHGAFPILRMNNITYAGEWDFSSLKYIDLVEKELPKHLVHKGQVLFNRTNSKELVGKTAVFRQETPMAFAGYLVRGIPNHLADPEYIAAFMNTPQMKTFLRNKCKSIVGMANINAREFQAIPIPKPPINVQHRFSAIVASVEQQKIRQRAHLVDLDALFASLQHRAFNGERKAP
jgi:type I restriction enzyme S subunit